MVNTAPTMGNLKRALLKSKIDEIIKLSTIPAVLEKIMNVTEDSNSTVEDLVKVIEHDQAIASRIVGVSNAIFYGFPRRISSISQAIIVLGFEMVKGLAISVTVFKGISKSNKANVTSLWEHSFNVAIAAVLIAEKSGLVSKDSAFLAGLLHDIGRPVLFQLFSDEYMKTSGDNIETLLELEQEAFGATHPEAGAMFAEKCKLPDTCITSIRYHHNPRNYRLRDNGDPLAYLVPIIYLADLIVADGREHSENYRGISSAHAEILKSVNITGQMLAEVEEMISGVRAESNKYYN